MIICFTSSGKDTRCLEEVEKEMDFLQQKSVQTKVIPGCGEKSAGVWILIQTKRPTMGDVRMIHSNKVDLDELKKVSTDSGVTKELAIKGAEVGKELLNSVGGRVFGIVVFNKGGILGLAARKVTWTFQQLMLKLLQEYEKLEHGQVAQTVNNKKEKVRNGIEAAFAYPLTLEKRLKMLCSRFMKYMVMLAMAETLRYGFAFYDNNASMYHVVSICSKDWHYTRMELLEKIVLEEEQKPPDYIEELQLSSCNMF
ncbi:hypothetical protein Tco_1387022 [Tanacetum coccineum]